MRFPSNNPPPPKKKKTGISVTGLKIFPIWTLQPGYRANLFRQQRMICIRSQIKQNVASDEVLKHGGQLARLFGLKFEEICLVCYISQDQKYGI